MPSVTHPRGQIVPPLASGAPLWKRALRGSIRVGQGLYFHDAFRVAPAMAFHFFLSLMPLLGFLGWAVGTLVRARGADAVLSPLLESVPTSTGATILAEARRLGDASHVGPLAAVGFVWIASGGAQGLMTAVEDVVGAPRRSWLAQRLLALLWVTAVMLALAAASYLLIQWTQWTELFRFKDELRVFSGAGERAVALLGSLGGAVVGLAAFYRLSVRHLRRVRRRVFPGALLAVACWLAISWGFGLYVTTLTDYAVFYGSLAAVAVLLVWLWLSSLAILVGAELNAQLEGLRD